MGLTDQHLVYGDDIPETEEAREYYKWATTKDPKTFTHAYTKEDKERDEGFNDFVSSALEWIENCYEDYTHSLNDPYGPYRKGVDEAREVIIEFLKDIEF